MNAITRIVLFGCVISMAACGGGGGGIPLIDCLLCDAEFKIKPGITANVGLDQSVVDGDTVILSGGVRTRGNCNARHEWKQTNGPKVGISGSTYLRPRFTAPAVTSRTTLTFKFKAWCSNNNRKDNNSVNIVVEPTSAMAMCLSAPLHAYTYVWTTNGCTTSSAEQAGDTRAVTLYRQLEVETNDTAATASSLIFPSRLANERLATDVDGSVSGANDRDDFFVMSPPESGLYELNLCNDPVVCMRGTVTERWSISVLDQDLKEVAATKESVVTEQSLWVDLDAGLPYYVRINVVDQSSPRWTYNMTVLSEAG